MRLGGGKREAGTENAENYGKSVHIAATPSAYGAPWRSKTAVSISQKTPRHLRRPIHGTQSPFDRRARAAKPYKHAARDAFWRLRRLVCRSKRAALPTPAPASI